jgi:ATP-dependent Zn protease
MSQYSPQLPTPPYPAATTTTLPRRRRGSLFGWLLFIGLTLLLFMLLSQRRNPSTATPIPLSEFTERLETGQVASVTVERDELYGDFVDAPTANTAAESAEARTASDSLQNPRRFRVALPNGLGETWGFTQWLIDHRHNATVTARNDANNYLVNILLPLIPWLLIFGFIWFFVFRQLRRTTRQQCLIAPTGPGRWIPDPPPMPSTGSTPGTP